MRDDRDRARRSGGARQSWNRRCDADEGAARGEGRDVIAVPSGVRILVATKPVDFRRGADGLAALAKTSFSAIRILGRSSSFARSGGPVEDFSLGRLRPDFVLEASRGRRVSLAADQRRRHASVGVATGCAHRWAGLVAPARARHSGAGDGVIKLLRAADLSPQRKQI